MRWKTWLYVLCTLVVLSGGGLLYAWYNGWFDSSVHNVAVGADETSARVAGNLDEALALAKAAQAKLQAMAGYQCVYLRDERIANELTENSLILTVLHEPFAVNMEWVEPRSKKGRKAAFVTGKNNGKMRVKVGFATLPFDLDYSIKMKESRHTLNEAGMLNLMNRFVKSWEEEKLAGETSTYYTEATLLASVGDKKYNVPCRCIETDHPESAKDKYVFHRVKIYFDKERGLPVRMEGYDWPSATEKGGRLMERYSYFDVKSEPPPKLSQIEL